MGRVFIYWDNSNLFIGAQVEAEDREGPSARHRVRISFRNMMKLARAERPVEKAIAAGSVPPEMRALWNRLESEGVEENGVFISLDDYYDAVTYLEPTSADYPTADPRYAAVLDLSSRPR